MMLDLGSRMVERSSPIIWLGLDGFADDLIDLAGAGVAFGFARSACPLSHLPY